MQSQLTCKEIYGSHHEANKVNGLVKEINSIAAKPVDLQMR
jgi:hypothetical protein